MVATIETTSEPGPRPAARACRVTAEYPQGGTGIPAGEMNCPGAAAQSRSLGTGFRAVDATNGFGLSPNALNINGADTYQFVGSDPVGLVDAMGTDSMVISPGWSVGTGVQPLAYPTPESVPIPSTPGVPSLGVSPWAGFNPPPIPDGQDNVHFSNGSSLNRDGSWKHPPQGGSTNITNAQREWLQSWGWAAPR